MGVAAVLVLVLVVLAGRPEPCDAACAYFPLRTQVAERPGSATAATHPRAQQPQEHHQATSLSYISYVVDIGLGDPVQQHAFVVDTGSATLAVSGPACRDRASDKPCHTAHHHYNPARSATAKNLHMRERVVYEKGSWEGAVFHDVVTLRAAHGAAPLRVNASFAVIDKTENFFERAVGNSGIWGLGYRQYDRPTLPPLFDSLLGSELVDSNGFSLALCGPKGHLWLGDVPGGESPPFRGALSFVPITPSPRGFTYYSVALHDIAVGSIPMRIGGPLTAIVDSGTTFLILPHHLYNQVITALRSYVHGVDPAIWDQYCIETDPNLWPSLTLQLDGAVLHVSGREYLTPQENFLCLGIGLNEDRAQQSVILGDTVLQGSFVHFDRSNARLGIAPAANNLSADGAEPCGHDPEASPIITEPLTELCALPGLDTVSCAESCGECGRAGGAWCARGEVEVWVEGVRSDLSPADGFCWPGSSFGLANATLRHVRIPGHGMATVRVACHAWPQSGHCLVPTKTLGIAGASAVVAIALLASILLNHRRRGGHCDSPGEARAGDLPLHKRALAGQGKAALFAARGKSACGSQQRPLLPRQPVVVL